LEISKFQLKNAPDFTGDFGVNKVPSREFTENYGKIHKPGDKIK
jgi:hypothetical protein